MKRMKLVGPGSFTVLVLLLGQFASIAVGASATTLVTTIVQPLTSGSIYIPLIFRNNRPPGGLEGRVYAGGFPIAGASVCVFETTDCTITEADGSYLFEKITIRKHIICATAKGYGGQELMVTILPGQTNTINFNLNAINQMGAIAGQVIDVMTLWPINEATVCLMNGSPCTLTASSGNYTLDSVPAGSHIVRALASGYEYHNPSVNVIANQTSLVNIRLSYIIRDDEIRILLIWGADPSDLDAHLWLPPNHPYHIYYDNRGYCWIDPFACLDGDVQSGYGPEIITLLQRFEGTYRFAVQKSSEDRPSTASGAHVRIYDSYGLITEYFIPTSGDGDWWYVFNLNGNTGVLTPHNTIMATSPGPY